MTATIAILQHAEKILAVGDPGLTPLGVLQAMRAARRLAEPAPVRLLSSPLLRARESMAPLAAATGLDVEVDTRLRERLNLDAGMTLTRFVHDWSRTERERDWTPPSGRSSRTTGADVRAVLDEVALEGAVVVIGCHGGATTDLLRDLLGDDELDRRAPDLIRLGTPGVPSPP